MQWGLGEGYGYYGINFPVSFSQYCSVIVSPRNSHTTSNWYGLVTTPMTLASFYIAPSASNFSYSTWWFAIGV